MTSMFDGIFDRVALSATNGNQLKKVEIQFRAQKYRRQILDPIDLKYNFIKFWPQYF